MTTRTEGDAQMTDTAPKQKSRSEMVRDIRTSEDTYFIKNNTRNRVSCSTPTQAISLGPAGRGEDVAILPKDLLDQPGFQRMWASGKITITDDPSIEEEMIESAGASELRKQKREAELSAMIEEPASNRDLLEKKCLISGQRVYQTQADIKNMVPPLAPEYKNRAHEFVASLSPDGKGGETVTFSKVTIEKE